MPKTTIKLYLDPSVATAEGRNISGEILHELTADFLKEITDARKAVLVKHLKEDTAPLTAGHEPIGHVDTLTLFSLLDARAAADKQAAKEQKVQAALDLEHLQAWQEKARQAPTSAVVGKTLGEFSGRPSTAPCWQVPAAEGRAAAELDAYIQTCAAERRELIGRHMLDYLPVYDAGRMWQDDIDHALQSELLSLMGVSPYPGAPGATMRLYRGVNGGSVEMHRGLTPQQFVTFSVFEKLSELTGVRVTLRREREQVEVEFFKVLGGIDTTAGVFL